MMVNVLNFKYLYAEEVVVVMVAGGVKIYDVENCLLALLMVVCPNQDLQNFRICRIQPFNH